MIRQVRNYRFNPFTEVNAFAVITDEAHAIPAASPYWVRLFEVPDADYSDPTSGTPVYVRDLDGNVFTEVASSPGVGEFRVDYTYKTGWVEFNSADADTIIKVCYQGTGSTAHAELINGLQLFQPITPFFGGDGSDGDATISSNTNLAESPAGSLVAMKQYDNLTIAAGITLGVAAGVKGLILAVKGVLKLEAGAIISVAGKGAAGGAAVGTGAGNTGGNGAFGGGGGGGGYSVYGGAAGIGGNGGGNNVGAVRGNMCLFSPGAGLGGAGGAINTNGGAGSKGAVISADDHYWRGMLNALIYGAGGGSGGGGSTVGLGAGGAGGGLLVINCNVLSIASGATFSAAGVNGAAGTSGGYHNGGGGGGAGGLVLIIANQIVGETPANLETSNCIVTGGNGGTSTCGGNGAAGAAGYKRVKELYEYNVY